MQASFQSHNKLVHLVGVGSLCGDDSIGLCIAQRIEQQACHGIAPRSLRVDFATSPIRLLDLVLHADTLVICDAWLADNAPIGTIRRWVWPNIEIENIRFTGSHDLSLGATLHLGERLEILPPKVLIWGISIAAEPSAFDCSHHTATAPSLPIDIHNDTPWQEWLSKSLLDLVPSIADRIMKDISDA